MHVSPLHPPSLRLTGRPLRLSHRRYGDGGPAGVAVEWKDRRIHALEKIAGTSMVLYHSLDHVALGG